MHAERSRDWRSEFGKVTWNKSGGNVLNLECVGIARCQDHLVERMNAREFHVAVGRECTLVAAQERTDFSAGIRSDQNSSIIETDGVEGIDRAPIQTEAVFLRGKCDGLDAIGADAQVIGRIQTT